MINEILECVLLFLVAFWANIIARLAYYRVTKDEYRKIQYFCGQYPCCDHINIALRSLIQTNRNDRNKLAIEELVQALFKSEGYFYRDNAAELTKMGFNIPAERINQ